MIILFYTIFCFTAFLLRHPTKQKPKSIILSHLETQTTRLNNIMSPLDYSWHFASNLHKDQSVEDGAEKVECLKK